MKKIDMYELGEEVLIKAKISDIIIENGEPRYKVCPESASDSLARKYTHTELRPCPPKPGELDDRK